MTKYSVYSDGSSSGRSNGRGGYGWVIVDNQSSSVVLAGYGGSKSTTNQRMEMEAAIAGLEAASFLKVFDLELVCDSEYVLKTAANKLNSQANLDLVERLRKIVKYLNPRLRWVKGHSGDMYNGVADALAKRGKEEV